MGNGTPFRMVLEGDQMKPLSLRSPIIFEKKRYEAELEHLFGVLMWAKTILVSL